jgi:hypothetical protein
VDSRRQRSETAVVGRRSPSPPSALKGREVRLVIVGISASRVQGCANRPGRSAVDWHEAERTYCHTFFALADDSALAFFQFGDPTDRDLFKTTLEPSPFRHNALAVDQDTQDGITKGG